MPEPIYLTARQVLNRYGRKSTIWLYRIVKRDPKFPRPLYIGGQKYFRLSDLEAYDRDPERAIAPVTAPAPERDAA